MGLGSLKCKQVCVWRYLVTTKWIIFHWTVDFSYFFQTNSFVSNQRELDVSIQIVELFLAEIIENYKWMMISCNYWLHYLLTLWFQLIVAPLLIKIGSKGNNWKGLEAFMSKLLWNLNYVLNLQRIQLYSNCTVSVSVSLFLCIVYLFSSSALFIIDSIVRHRITQ